MSTQKSAAQLYIFHSDLSDRLPGEDYRVYIAGKQYPLVEHTAETLADARKQFPSLEKFKDSELTHYTAQPVEVPYGSVIRYSIRHQNKTKTLPGKNGIHHVAILVTPAQSEHTAVKSHVTHYVETAKTLISHHCDLNSMDATAAACIQEHMDQFKAADTYALISNLAAAMKAAGPPATDSGWAHYVDFNAGDLGTQQALVPTDDIMQQAGDPMTAVLVSTKNDPRLKGACWHAQTGNSVQSAGENVAKDQGVYLPKLSADDNWTAALADTTETYGLQASIQVVDSGKRQVELTLSNYYVRCLGAYIQFLDADGNAMNTPNWYPDDGALASEVINAVKLDRPDLRYLGWVSAVDTVKGVIVSAVPGQLVVKFTFPDGAVSAIIYGGGFGIGCLNFGKGMVIGAVTTGLVNFVVPSLFMGFGVAAQTYKPLYLFLKKPKLIAAAVVLGLAYFGGMIGYDGIVNKKIDWSAISSLGQILFDKSVTALLGWCEEQMAEGVIEDEIPFAGWVILAVNIAADVMQMSETIIELVNCPYMIPNNISTTITSSLTIHPDPRRGAFPAVPSGSRASYIAKMIYQSQNRAAITSEPVPLDPSSYPPVLSTSFSNTLGGKVKFEVDFYIDDWMAGKATTGVLENNEDNTANITLYLLQKPIPLDSHSIYQHTAILGYTGQYSWIPQSQPPTATLANANNSQTGNAISAWMGLAISQRYGMVGLSYKASGLGITDCSNHATGQLYAFLNVNIPELPMTNVKFPTCAFSGLSQLVYDCFPPKFLMQDGMFQLDKNGNPEPDPAFPDLGSYYIDPRKAGNDPYKDGGYYLRKVKLDDTSGTFDMSAGQPGYGRFQYFPDAITLHPGKHAIAVNRKNCKMMITPLAPDGGLPDGNIPMALTFAGKALDYNGSNGRAGLLFTPVAITCSYDGTILVLEQLLSEGLNLARIQAFDLNGKPVSCFSDSNQPSPMLSLPANVTYLDLVAVGDNLSTFLFVLYYNNAGEAPGDYSMSIYQYGKNAPAGSLLVTTPNIPAAAINVDMWHTLYTLNWQMTQDGNGNNAGPGGRTVPSASEWLPPVPKQ
ncbi:hypothetical protein [Chitinophaga qingshengii]|uniref:Uncharacterized protein n=1 Tax=Chitinophaga qingshengii TaxID=1569794 RepID=A0ABR7TKT3_9BACT|nr:hypothetical protein [Chitinophaga qingshengii]MBC9930148.1 hypothetical protein [Chitinophaga qingshengii]